MKISEPWEILGSNKKKIRTPFIFFHLNFALIFNETTRMEWKKGYFGGKNVIFWWKNAVFRLAVPVECKKEEQLQFNVNSTSKDFRPPQGLFNENFLSLRERERFYLLFFSSSTKVIFWHIFSVKICANKAKIFLTCKFCFFSFPSFMKIPPKKAFLFPAFIDVKWVLIAFNAKHIHFSLYSFVGLTWCLARKKTLSWGLFNLFFLVSLSNPKPCGKPLALTSLFGQKKISQSTAFRPHPRPHPRLEKALCCLSLFVCVVHWRMQCTLRIRI